MADENQPSKKRAAGRELSQDNPGLDDEEDVAEQEMGTFKKASDEVLAGRRIVKVRRQQTSTAPSAPSSNPFAGIRLVPPTTAPTAPPAAATTEGQAAEDKAAGEDPEKKAETISEAEVESKEPEAEVESKEPENKHGEAAPESNEDKAKTAPPEPAGDAGSSAEKESIHEPAQDDKGDVGDTAKRDAETESADEKKGDGSAEKTAEAEPAQQAEGDKAEDNDKEQNEKPDASGSGGAALSSFQQLSNTQNAFTGLSGTGFSSATFSFGPLQKDGSPSQSSVPTFSFGASTNGSTPLFGTAGASLGNKSEGSAFRPMPEVPRETGEENEETVFSADSALFEFFDGGWKERGKGEVKVNVLKGETQKARLVMRAKGNLRLILNASLYPDMKLTKMDKKGITFACVNIATEGKDSLSTFALKFKDVSVVEEFSSAVSAYKDKPATALKTPENSPKASDD